MRPPASTGGRGHTMSPKRSDASTGSGDSAASAAGDTDAARGARGTETDGSAEGCESDPIEVLYTAARTAKLLLGALVSALTALKLLGVL